MSLRSDSNAWDPSVSLTEPDIQVGETLLGGSSHYSVLEFIGEGGFGKVAKCLNLKSKKTVAVKILKKDSDSAPDEEVFMMNMISVLNTDQCNLVQFYEQFEYLGQTCLAFEMLDRTLYDLLDELNWIPLKTSVIRPIAQQLLVALDALQDLGVLHTDIKPDNVMFVDLIKQPLRVKLIDFGQAIPASLIHPGLTLQPVGYRAPEVSLGLPFTAAVDVWGLGCLLAFLFLSENLFPVTCEYQTMSCMVKLLGQPEDHMLEAGLYTPQFFTKDAAEGSRWRLLTHEEYLAASGSSAEQQHSSMELPSCLDTLVDVHPHENADEYLDQTAFINLLKELLVIDGNKRISPREALQHPFITMSHLREQPLSRDYLTTSQTLMGVCSVGGSAGSLNTSAASELDQDSSNGLDAVEKNWEDSDAASSVLSLGEIQPTDLTSETERCSTETSSSDWSLGEVREDVCCSDAGSMLTDGNPASCSVSASEPSVGCGEEPAGSCEEDFSSSPAESTQSAVSASSGCTNFGKRIRTFFTRVSETFSCCCRPQVEE